MKNKNANMRGRSNLSGFQARHEQFTPLETNKKKVKKDDEKLLIREGGGAE